MEATVKKWGNSLGFRLPKSFAQQIGVKDGSHVEIAIVGEKIIITPIQEEDTPLDVLLDQITPYNKHNEIETDSPQGKEIW